MAVSASLKCTEVDTEAVHTPQQSMDLYICKTGDNIWTLKRKRKIFNVARLYVFEAMSCWGDMSA